MALKSTQLDTKPKDVAVARVTEPAWLTQQGMGTTGFIPRRRMNDDPYSPHLLSIENMLMRAALEPMRVLTYLPEILPEVGKAVWNGLRLGCGKDALRIRAMKLDNKGNIQEEATDGTSAINDLFENLPPEVGNLQGALSQNYLMTMFSGMCAVEVVPGKRNKGLVEVWPLDTLSLQLRPDTNGAGRSASPSQSIYGNVKSNRLQVWQRQRVMRPGNYANEYNGFVRLPEERVFWKSLDAFPDEPYGRCPLMGALMPAIEMVAFMKDLLLAWHRVGTPKWDVGFDYEMWAKIAKEELNITDVGEISDYIETQFDKVVAMFEGLRPDDTFFHDLKSKVTANGSGGQWPNVSEIHHILQMRLVLALKEVPTLAGVVEGSTETWSSVDWQIYSQGMETMVQHAAYPLVKAAQMHITLLGMPYKVVAEYKPIRSNQRMVDAQSEQLEIDNEATKRDQGWQTQDDASLRVTGSKSVTTPDKEMLGKLPKPIPGNGPAGVKPKNSEGKTPQGPSKGANYDAIHENYASLGTLLESFRHSGTTD